MSLNTSENNQLDDGMDPNTSHHIEQELVDATAVHHIGKEPGQVCTSADTTAASASTSPARVDDIQLNSTVSYSELREMIERMNRTHQQEMQQLMQQMQQLLQAR